MSAVLSKTKPLNEIRKYKKFDIKENGINLIICPLKSRVFFFLIISEFIWKNMKSGH